MKRTASLALCLLGLCGALTVHAQNVEYIGSALWTGMNDIKVVGNYAYCAFANGLVILNVSNPSVPVFVSQLYFQGEGRGIDVVGDYVYLADGDYGLKIINVSNPQNPTFAGSYDTPGYAYGVFVAGDYAYLADDTSGLQIMNINNPQSPTLAGSCNTPGYALDVFVADGYAYLVDFQSGLQIVNVSNPQNPTLAGSYDTPGNANDVFVAGSYAYIADGLSLQIVSVSNPVSPTLVRSYDTPGSAMGIFVADSYAYVADWSSLQILNVSNPESPAFIGAYSTSDAEGVFTANGYAYVGDYLLGLQIVNVMNPQNPFLAGSYDTPGDALNVFVKDDFIYVADGSSLLILHFNPQGVEEEPLLLPRELRLAQNYPNPFNPTTMLSYTLDKTGPAELSIFNALGQRAAVLFSGMQAAGEHRATWDAAGFPSGAYYARLKSAEQTQTVRMLLLK